VTTGGLDHLWAGWRTEYITSMTEETGASSPGRSATAADPPDDRDSAARCVFCRILASGLPDGETHVVWRSPDGLVVALLNAYPYGSGHVLVMPVRHTGDLETLAPAESAALWAVVTDTVRTVKVAYRPDGVNVGANLGRAAGAGVPGHLHVHVLPRWGGDSNFMTSIAETRVLPETLSVTADKLRRAWSPGRAEGAPKGALVAVSVWTAPV
jgi:ATP adenylyltransferase